MFRNLKMSFLVVLSFMATAASAVAAPSLMGYSGRLYDTKGAPLSGSHNITVSIFAHSSGGAELHNQEFAKTAVTDGYFYVAMDEFDDLAALFSDQDRFLEIEIDGEVLEPRQQIGAVPWAFGGSATTAGVGLPTDCTGGQFAAWDGKKWICSTASSSGGVSLPSCTEDGKYARWSSGHWICDSVTVPPSSGTGLPTCTVDNTYAHWTGGHWSCDSVTQSSGGIPALPTCAANTKLQWTSTSPNAPWSCVTDLVGGPNGVSCDTNQKPAWNGSSWTCVADQLGPNGVTCAANQKPSWTSLGWSCTADEGDITEIAAAAGSGINTSSNAASGKATISVNFSEVLQRNVVTGTTAAAASATAASSGVFSVNNSSSDAGSIFKSGLVGTVSGNAGFKSGVAGSASGTGANLGVRGEAMGSTGGNTGVFGYAANSATSNVGVYGATGANGPHDFAGVFDGKVQINGDTEFIGKLSVTGAKNRRMSLQAYEFVPWGSGVTWYRDDFAIEFRAAQSEYMEAPINLPDGATLTGVNCYVRATGTLKLRLFPLSKGEPVGNSPTCGVGEKSNLGDTVITVTPNCPAKVTNDVTGGNYRIFKLEAEADEIGARIYACSVEYDIVSL